MHLRAIEKWNCKMHRNSSECNGIILFLKNKTKHCGALKQWVWFLFKIQILHWTLSGDPKQYQHCLKVNKNIFKIWCCLFSAFQYFHGFFCYSWPHQNRPVTHQLRIAVLMDKVWILNSFSKPSGWYYITMTVRMDSLGLKINNARESHLALKITPLLQHHSNITDNNLHHLSP